MNEGMPSSQKTHVIAEALSKIGSLSSNVERNTERLRALVDTVNALLIPKGWIGIDTQGRLHATYVAPEDGRPGRAARDDPGPHQPMALSFAADFIWEYSLVQRTVRCTKSRDGSVTHGQVLPCGGPVK